MKLIVLPVLAFVVTFAGLVGLEPPPTEEEIAAAAQREELTRIEAERAELLESLERLESEQMVLQTKLGAIEASQAAEASPAQKKALRHLRARAEADAAGVQQEFERIEGEKDTLEARAEEWVRRAYGLTKEAAGPGFLAATLWGVDKAASQETAVLAQRLRETLHITESASTTAAVRVKRVLHAKYVRRSVISAAATLATIALLDASEPAFGWLIGRWWKLAVAAGAALLTFLLVGFLEQRGVVE